MITKEELVLVLGGLLHDIGKFEFRTTDQRRKHTSFGDFFVSEYLGKVESLRPMLEEIRLLVAHHHDAEAGNEFLRRADHIAAAERQVETNTQTLRTLISVLAGIDVGKGDVSGEVYRYRPGAIDYNNPFPEHGGVQVKEWKPDAQEVFDEHHAAWEAFCGDVRQIPDRGAEAWVETFLQVMHKHLSRVVSAAYKSHPDISLYDHGRSVAATALCLHRAEVAGEPFLLVQGDLSGIQAFIYKLAAPEEEGGTKQMAKRLRGRSFYISLLTESAARHYLHRLDLPSCNLLFCGGGHFMILAPNTEKVRGELEKAERAVNHLLFKRLRGDLALACAATPASEKLIKEDFPKLMQQSSAELSRAKNQKFRAIMDEQFFAPQDFDKTMDVCPVCQADFVKGDKTCGNCADHVEIGRKILKAEYQVRIEGEWEESGDKQATDFDELGFRWVLAEDGIELGRLLGRLHQGHVHHVHVDRLNETAFLNESTQSSAEHPFTVSFGFRALGQYAPEDEKDGGPREFGELAKIGTGNYPMLGVVRMDVDSLGAVFATGLGERRSLARTATLSREMDLFFSGYINKLARDHQVYITYAGGDDLFVVGSWVRALAFSRQLRREFGRFACDNPNLTLSGGILFCKDSFPIGRAAEVAGELEEDAKTANDGAKNAVAIFGEVVSWNRLECLLDYGEELLQLVDADEIPRSLVHRVLQISRENKESRTEEKQDVRKVVRNRMRLKYLVARRGATSRAISENQQGKECNRKLAALARLVTEDELLDQVSVPASYVLYHTRKLNHKED